MAACRWLWLWCVPQHHLGEWSTTRIHLLMVHPWQHAEGFGFSVWVWCVPQHHLGTINHMFTMGLVEFLDSLLMVHPWQHADGDGFGVNLNTILELSTTCVRVQWVWLNSFDSLLMVHPWLHAEGFGFVFGVYLNTILELSTMTNLLILLLPWQTVYWRLCEWTVTLGALIVLMVMIKDLCLWLHRDYQESNHQSLLRKGCWMWQEIENNQDGGGAGYDIEPFIIWNWSDIANYSSSDVNW